MLQNNHSHHCYLAEFSAKCVSTIDLKKNSFVNIRQRLILLFHCHCNLQGLPTFNFTQFHSLKTGFALSLSPQDITYILSSNCVQKVQSQIKSGFSSGTTASGPGLHLLKTYKRVKEEERQMIRTKYKSVFHFQYLLHCTEYT